MIDINDITVRIGSKVLLSHTSAHISDGQKVGLIGANGCGKSTLFKVLKGELDTETGSVSFPSRYKVATVAQEIADTNVPILEFVLSQDVERTQLLASLETASDMELGEIHERLNSIGASSSEARASSILNGLGFSNDDLTHPIKEFSGGWRMRLALAGALFQPSDVLLLDEPTNHLDLEASIWLESHLNKYRGTLLIISHDKTILNALCDHIIHFDNGILISYTGNYDTFEVTRAMQRELLAKQSIKQEAKKQHLQSFVDRFRYKASKAKQAQSRIKMLEKMQSITIVEDNNSTCFDFPKPEHLAPPLITLEKVTVGYDDKVVLQNLSLQINDNDRIALLGANGNGKSTFAKLLADRLNLMDGEMRRSKKISVGYFAQHQTEELPLEQTPVEYMTRLMGDKTETKVRSQLARFGLSKEKAITVIDKLSGGEKARLLFAAMTYNAPALLILDEPTNHLDMEARDALINALNEYEGSVILITHDLHLIELISDDLWLIKDGTCKVFDGDLQDYRNLLLGVKNKPKKELSPTEKKEEKQKYAERKAEYKDLNTQIKRTEREIEKLNQQKQALEKEFEKELGTEQMIALQKESAYLEVTLSEYEAQWLELSDKLEKL